MPRPRTRSPMARTVSLLAAGLTLAGCSSGTTDGRREYAVPPSLCGNHLPASALAPLLPAGKKISSVKTGSPGFIRCRLVVDERVVVTSIVERRDSSTTLSDVAYGTYGLGPDSVEKQGKYVVSDAQGVGRVDCGGPRKEDHETFTMIRAEDVEAGTPAMVKAITALTAAASTAKACTDTADSV